MSLTDAVGRQTTFSYELAAQPLLITKITDPFGRTATVTYDLSGTTPRLSSITDVIGITSSFSYDSNSPSLVNQLTTPYGTTIFAYTAPGTIAPRYVQVTDPAGYHERVEFVMTGAPYPPDGGVPVPCYNGIAGCPVVPPAAPFPQMPLPQRAVGLEYRNAYYWDKNAFIAAGCDTTASVGCPQTADAYAISRITHFTYKRFDSDYMWPVVQSLQNPFENRIWYNYLGQDDTFYLENAGIYNPPDAVGRALAAATSPASTISLSGFDTAHYFNRTSATDPKGRVTNFTYDNSNTTDPTKNGIDLTSITQTNMYPATSTSTLGQFTYNTPTTPSCTAPPHRPCTYIDASGLTTTYTYNAAGQVTSVSVPNPNPSPPTLTTTYNYDPSGNLTSIIDPNSVTIASFTYDAYARVRTYTDSSYTDPGGGGWTVTYDYDAADRITKKTYLDNTAEIFTYHYLDLATYRDRRYHTWTYTYDADRRPTQITDPLGGNTVFGYASPSRLSTTPDSKSLTDPKGYTTTWIYDAAGRLVTKQYADGKTLTYAYDPYSGLLSTVTDPLGQVKTFSYAYDDRLAGIAYSGTLVNPTHNVTFTDDTYFPRPTQMVDGTGTTNYTYYATGGPGALKLDTEGFIPTGGSSNVYQLLYAYDLLGRMTCRTFTSSCTSGTPTETFGYDALSRLISHSNDLGVFSLSYLGETRQPTQRQLGGGPLKTAWSYQPNVGDRRLASVNNTGLSSGQYSNFTITTKPTLEDWISEIDESTDGSTIATPATGTQSATYNNLNQLTNLSGQAYTYDNNGNLTADGVRNYAWDAENRLVKITYAGVSGQETDFAYDGLGRRTAITSIPAGGGAGTTTGYVWCGSRLCQARNSTYTTTSREYLVEGEYLPGSPAQTHYYGIDQVGSVRRVFASTSNAPAYDYDPYGNLTSSASRFADFGYAGMLYNQDSSLSLTWYRVYDPSIGRWISRDPIGEISDASGNLYLYVHSSPISNLDILGLDTQWGVQLGGTVAYGSGGIGGSVSIGISIPDNPLNIGAYQYFHTVQVNNLQDGTGAFVGGGLSSTAGKTTGPLPQGEVSDCGWYSEGDVGFGVKGAGISQQGPYGQQPNGESIGISPMAGVGVGAYNTDYGTYRSSNYGSQTLGAAVRSLFGR
jgi:RHS repeat-associated protein